MVEELIKELNNFIEEEKEKNFEEEVFKLFNEQEEEDFIYAIKDFVPTFIDNQYLDEESLFEMFTGLEPKLLKKMNEDLKFKLREKIKEAMKNLTIGKIDHSHIYYRSVELLKDRVKRITEGKDPSRYTWITMEEVEAYFGYYKNISLLYLEKMLGFYPNDFEEKVLENILKVIESPLKKYRSMEEFIHEDTFKNIFPEEKLSILKKMSYEWYQHSKKEKFFYRFGRNVRIGNIDYIQKRLFLFTKEEIERYQEVYYKSFNSEFQKIKQTNTQRNQEKAKEMRGKLLQVMEWNR